MDADHIRCNLETVRDWGYAPEYAKLAIDLLSQDGPGDFVIATGEAHTVRDLVSAAFGLVGRDWQAHVHVDSHLVRRSEAVPIVGDAAKLVRTLGRGPSIKFESVLRLLLANDLRALGCDVPFAVPKADG